MIVLDPPNTMRIDEIWAWVSQDDAGNEGIISVSSPAGQLPLIAADKERLKSLRPIIRELYGKTKKKIVLIKLSQRTDIETL